MPRNDPSETGGLFIGRRPGTAPLRLRAQPEDFEPSPRRRRFDEGLAALIFVCQVILCASLWLPQPLGGLWVGSMVNYLTGSVVLGILSAFIVIMIMLGITLVILRIAWHSWRAHRVSGRALDRFAQRAGSAERRRR